jgi:hypothetical protein
MMIILLKAQIIDLLWDCFINKRGLQLSSKHLVDGFIIAIKGGGIL